MVQLWIQNLKNKHTFPKKSKNWGKLSSLNLTEREETKSKYFAPMLLWSFSRLEVRDNQDMDKGPSFPFSVLWAVCISIEVPQSDSYLGQFLPPKPAKKIESIESMFYAWEDQFRIKTLFWTSRWYTCPLVFNCWLKFISSWERNNCFQSLENSQKLVLLKTTI